MKKTLFKIFILTIGLTTTYAQNIKDFYIPDLTLYNGAKVYAVNSNGDRVDIIDDLYYTDNKDGTFKVTEIKGGIYDPTAILIRTVKFTKTEVQLIEEKVKSLIKAGNKSVKYFPPKILLKMPKQGQTTRWVNESEEGETTEYTVSWTTVKVEDVTKRALKIVEEPSNGVFFKAQVTYYAEGTGLMKEDFIDMNDKLYNLRKFDTLFYDQNFKN